MNRRLPLSTLLSQTLIAYTIEFDNEFEHQVPHRTTNHGSTPGTHRAPWLVSMAMWTKFMQFIPEDGISVGELKRVLGSTDKSVETLLTRMGKWWGYVTLEPKVAGNRSKKIDSAALVRPTVGGRRAIEVWRGLAGVLENRWRKRFGDDEFHRLIESLTAVVGQFKVPMPDSLPILGYGLFSKGPYNKENREAPGSAGASEFRLASLLSKALLAFAIEFEQTSEVSLAISANVLRLCGTDPVHVRELPRLSSVSKEAIAMALSFLEKGGYGIVEPESPGSRTKILVLTAKGRAAERVYSELVWAIEEKWQARYGKDAVRTLREALEYFVGEPAVQLSPLFRGLEPYPDGWRSAVPKPEGLPHYPMMLHRGGFPDGS